MNYENCGNDDGIDFIRIPFTRPKYWVLFLLLFRNFFYCIIKLFLLYFDQRIGVRS